MTETSGPEPTSLSKPVDNRGLSVLGSLAKRREEVVESDTTTLRVPRWTEPELYVRYGVVPHPTIRKSLQQQEKARKDRIGQAELRANIDILIHGVVAVFARLDGDEETEYSLRPGDPNGELTTFDADLAENLKCGPSATDVIKALYISDGDIMSAASAVVDFSGYRDAEADEKIAGE